MAGLLNEDRMVQRDDSIENSATPPDIIALKAQVTHTQNEKTIQSFQTTNMFPFIPRAVYIRNDGGSQREGKRLRIFLCSGAPPRLTSVSVADCHDHKIHVRRTNLFN